MASKLRIKRAEDYRRIVRSGYRVTGRYTLAHAVLRTNAEKISHPPQFGFIITKAVGNAVVRNLIRRRLQGICYEQLRQGFNSADVVLRVFPQAATASYSELAAHIGKQFTQIQERERAS